MGTNDGKGLRVQRSWWKICTARKLRNGAGWSTLVEIDMGRGGGLTADGLQG